jgi:NTP pyrophosphatase (non-canonical NTP hydrolase)
MISRGPGSSLNTEAATYAPMKALRAWHTASSDPKIDGSNRYIEERDDHARRDNVKLRMKLIEEEFEEVMDELLDLLNGVGDRAKLAKELGDLLYVTYGTADDFEIPLETVFDAVHESNMTKVVGTRVMRRPDGKIIKGPEYREPDIESLIVTGVAN